MIFKKNKEKCNKNGGFLLFTCYFSYDKIKIRKSKQGFFERRAAFLVDYQPRKNNDLTKRIARGSPNKKFYSNKEKNYEENEKIGRIVYGGGNEYEHCRLWRSR
jgi:hypothetical protein